MGLLDSLKSVPPYIEEKDEGKLFSMAYLVSLGKIRGRDGFKKLEYYATINIQIGLESSRPYAPSQGIEVTVPITIAQYDRYSEELEKNVIVIFKGFIERSR